MVLHRRNGTNHELSPIVSTPCICPNPSFSYKLSDALPDSGACLFKGYIVDKTAFSLIDGATASKLSESHVLSGKKSDSSCSGLSNSFTGTVVCGADASLTVAYLELTKSILSNFAAATAILRLLRSKYSVDTIINPTIPAVGPRLTKYNNNITISALTIKLSRSNNKFVGKYCENSIITVRIIKYGNSV